MGDLEYINHMHKMTNLEYSFMIREIAPLLTGKHLRRIKKLDEGVYRLKIGDMEVLAQSGVRLHLTRQIEQSDLSDKFSEKAEKELDNARLLSIEQINQDRIISFVFDKGLLIFEMFGDGNIILVREGKTVCAERYESWSDRAIKAGEEYHGPRSSTSGMTGIELNERFIVVSLSKLPLGKEYAVEALLRAGIDEKTPGTSLSKPQAARLEKEISSIRENATPYVFYDPKEPDKARGIALANLSTFADLEAKTFKTFSEAADEYYSKYEKPNPLSEKLEKRLEKQIERRSELLGEERSFKEKGDFIYSHYQEAESVITLAKGGKFDELEKNNNAKVNKKDKSVDVEIRD